jgi:type I restriction enzyme R subunit
MKQSRSPFAYFPHLGLQQGLDYSATLGIPFVFASNGDGFVFHDKTHGEVPTQPGDAHVTPAKAGA